LAEEGEVKEAATNGTIEAVKNVPESDSEDEDDDEILRRLTQNLGVQSTNVESESEEEESTEEQAPISSISTPQTGNTRMCPDKTGFILHR
jgi:hypothetical protein